jgi:hypothetical protein
VRGGLASASGKPGRSQPAWNGAFTLGCPGLRNGRSFAPKTAPGLPHCYVSSCLAGRLACRGLTRHLVPGIAPPGPHAVADTSSTPPSSRSHAMIRLLRQSLVAAAALLLPIALVRAWRCGPVHPRRRELRRSPFHGGTPSRFSDSSLPKARSRAVWIPQTSTTAADWTSATRSASWSTSCREVGCSHDGVPVDYGTAPQAPFPEPGEDPTPDTESLHVVQRVRGHAAGRDGRHYSDRATSR